MPRVQHTRRRVRASRRMRTNWCVPSCFETPRHSASARAFAPVFDGLWTRVIALKARLLSRRAGEVCVPRTKRTGRSLMRAKNQPVAVEKDACRGLPVSGLLFTGSCATAARGSDTRLEIRLGDCRDFRPRRVVWADDVGASKRSNLRV